MDVFSVAFVICVGGIFVAPIDIEGCGGVPWCRGAVCGDDTASLGDAKWVFCCAFLLFSRRALLPFSMPGGKGCPPAVFGASNLENIR